MLLASPFLHTLPSKHKVEFRGGNWRKSFVQVIDLFGLNVHFHYSNASFDVSMTQGAMVYERL